MKLSKCAEVGQIRSSSGTSMKRITKEQTLDKVKLDPCGGGVWMES